MRKEHYFYLALLILAFAATGFIFLRYSNKTETIVETDAPVPASAPQASWMGGSLNVEEIIKSSDIIISGRAVGSTPEQRADLIFTKQEISIDAVYKGDVKNGESIIILQTGGRLGEKETPPFQEAPLLDIESNYLLFLQYTPERHYLVMGGFQGIAKIINNELVFNVSDDYIAKELSGMSFENAASVVQSKVEEQAGGSNG